MRDLKFRAWYGNEIMGPFLLKDIPALLMAQLSHGEDVTIEQYTGLKDKNGKEIYERDKVRFSYVNTYEQRSFPEYVDLIERTIKDGEGVVYWNENELSWYVKPKEEYKTRSGDTVHTALLEMPLAWTGLSKQELDEINGEYEGEEAYPDSVIGISVIDEEFEAAFS